jgi:transcription antitermination factor NusG
LEQFVEGANNYDSWYVVRSKPRMEDYAAMMLKNHLGLVVFLPKGRVIAHRNEIQFAPFFPGYLFIQANSKNLHPGRINTCPGVLHLIAFDGELEAIPHELFEIMCENINEFNREGRLLREPYQAGNASRIQEGPLKEMEKVFLGYPTNPIYRIRALISVLGSLKETQTDSRVLEKVPYDERRRHIRFTRGRGRKTRSCIDYYNHQ